MLKNNESQIDGLMFQTKLLLHGASSGNPPRSARRDMPGKDAEDTERTIILGDEQESQKTNTWRLRKINYIIASTLEERVKVKIQVAFQATPRAQVISFHARIVN